MFFFLFFNHWLYVWLRTSYFLYLCFNLFNSKMWNSSTFTYALLCVCKSLQSCPNLCGPMDWGPPVSSVHGILKARILEWIAILSSRWSQPRDQTHISYVSALAPLAPPGKHLLFFGLCFSFFIPFPSFFLSPCILFLSIVYLLKIPLISILLQLFEKLNKYFLY